MKNQSGEFYSIQEVADMLKVVYLTVYRWVQKGTLTSYKLGKQHRIKKSDLEKFIEERKQNGNSKL